MRFLVFFAFLQVLGAQQPASTDWSTKTIQLKYLDPEQLREVFAGRSFVMQANRELKTLTVSGPAQFLQDVEQTGKALDVSPDVAGDVELTVFLLSSDTAGSPTAELPPDLQKIVKTLQPAPPKGFGLTDMRTVRIGNGQAGEIRLNAAPAAKAVSGAGSAASSDASIARISFDSVSASTGDMKRIIRLVGVRSWLRQTNAQPSAGTADSDLTANLSLPDGQTVIAARSGVAKPIVIAMRASASR